MNLNETYNYEQEIELTNTMARPVTKPTLVNTNPLVSELEFYENVEGTKFNTSTEVYTDMQNLNNASRIIPDNMVVYDIDDPDTSKRVLNILKDLGVVTHTVITTRGIHLYFMRSDYPSNYKVVKGVTYLGIPVEVKTDKVVVKTDGQARKILNENIYAQLPLFFCIPPMRRDSVQDLTSVEVGERNNVLFSHNRKVSNNILLKPHTKQLFELINKYVLLEPLDDKELKNISRPLDVEENTTLTTSQAMKLLGCKNYNGELYIKIDGKYTCHKETILKHIGKLLNLPLITFAKQSQELYNSLYVLSDDHIVKDNEVIKKFNNGYLDKDYNFIEEENFDVTPYEFDITYDPTLTEYEPIDTLLNNIANGDPEYIELLKCVIATPMITSHNFKSRNAKMYFLYGSGSNGKSTFTTMLDKFYKYTSSVELRHLDSPLHKSTLKNTLVNFCNDESEKCLTGHVLQNLKTITTAEPTQVKELYRNPYTAVICPTVIATLNTRINTADTGLLRRLQWLPVEYKVTEEMKQARPYYQLELETDIAKSYLLNIVIEYAKKLKNGYIPKLPKVVSRFQDEYKEESNHFVSFLKSYFFEPMYLAGDFDQRLLRGFHKTPIRDVNAAYDNWLEDNGITHAVWQNKKNYGLNMFGFQVKNVRLGDKTQAKGLFFNEELFEEQKEFIMRLYDEYIKD